MWSGIVYALCSVVFSVCYFKCPVDAVVQAPQTYLSQIYEKCSAMSNDTRSRVNNMFKDCIPQDIKLLKDVNDRELECLMLFESIKAYCAKNGSIVVPNFPPKVTVDEVCNNCGIFPYNSSYRELVDSKTCKEFCVDEYFYVKTVCSLSCYFSNYTIPRQTTKDMTVTTNIALPKIDTNKSSDVAKHLAQMESKTDDHSKGSKGNVDSAMQPRVKDPPTGKITNKSSDSKPSIGHEVNMAPNADKGGKEQLTRKLGNNMKGLKNPPVIDTRLEIPTDNSKQEEKHNDVPHVQPVNKVNNTIKEPASESRKSALPSKPTEQIEEGKNDADMPISNIDYTPDEDDRLDEDAVQPPVSNPMDAHKPYISDMPVYNESNMEGDSYFLSYFIVLSIFVVVCYITYHNKQKIMALIVEGRRGSRRSSRNRRPSAGNYSKLESNLEEVISSTSCPKSTKNVIY